MLKSRNEAQNSFVFNFVNTKKDTSHLEYDGLDLSNRTKKVRFFCNSVFFVLYIAMYFVDLFLYHSSVCVPRSRALYLKF